MQLQVKKKQMLILDPLLDALNPDGYPLIEAEAKLLFLKGGHYCFQYREGKREAYKFLSPDTIKAAFQHEQIDTGWIPKGMQRLGICRQGQWFVQFVPPKKHTFTFVGLSDDGEPTILTIPMPGLVFFLCGETCYIWASKVKEFDPEAPIFHTPLPNIYGDGSICMGVDNHLNCQAEGIERLTKAWQMFSEAPFNNHLPNGKSKTHPQDIRQKLKQLQKANRYPINDLIQIGSSSVKVIINMIINR
jgi:hypothetical protein